MTGAWPRARRMSCSAAGIALAFLALATTWPGQRLLAQDSTVVETGQRDTTSGKKGAKKRERAAEERRRGDAFFESSAPLTLTLRADFKAIVRDRDTSTAKWRPAALLATDSTGAPVRVDAQLKTRGIFRLKPAICGFPPLRLNIVRKSAKGTMFEGLDRPKLVTHCQDRPDYEQIILHEYLLYKMYNAVTPLSFRARLARMVYEDVLGKTKPDTAWGFLIEEDEAMAARNGGKILKQKGAQPADLDQEAMTRVSVFQYMIGNTDWSVPVLHNVTLVMLPTGAVIPVAYDFDFAGIISARYAGPDPRLPIKSVRERLYRGPCISEAALAPTLELFRSKRDAIYAVYDSFDPLLPGIAKRSREYLDAFFKTIDEPGGPKYSMLASCLKDRLPE